MGQGFWNPPICKCLGGYCLKAHTCARMIKEAKKKDTTKAFNKNKKVRKAGYWLNGKFIETTPVSQGGVWKNPDLTEE